MKENVSQRSKTDRVLNYVELIVIARKAFLSRLVMAFLVPISVFLIVLLDTKLKENKG